MCLIFAPSNSNRSKMSKKEAEEKVLKIKQLLIDYQKIATFIGLDEKTKERTINIFLDDLSKALKESKGN